MTRLDELLRAEGLRVTGAFEPGPEDGAPVGTRTLCLIAAAGAALWERFSGSPEFADGHPDPLDRWSRRVLDRIAGETGGVALLPFGGPPYHPFLAWGRKAEGARPSPVGMLVSEARGLWISWRGALALRERLDLGPATTRDPCLGCPAPCLTACPVGALGAGKPYDVAACVRHASGAEGAACREGGCLVRHACPAGAGAAPPASQRVFHMAAFLAAHADDAVEPGLD